MIQKTIHLLEQMFASCDMDYDDLKETAIDSAFFEAHDNVRIVNSFLFNFSKLQDKIGQKFIKQVLYVLKEIDDFEVPFKDVLNIAEKLALLSTDEWERFREIRNLLSHEYPFSIEERVENIQQALEIYPQLKSSFERLKHAVER